MKLGNKGLTKGAIAGIAGGAVVTVGVVAAILLNLGGETAFRNISVIDKLGTVSVYRESIKDTLEAYVDMNLESGDEVTVGAASELDLKLDDDKYVYVEENTKMSLVAEGDKENSKTQIYLSEGATLHKLDSKLNDNSSYEIETPNATMAIRGTITWARVYIGEDGEIHSDFIVYEGKTSLRLHDTDGNPVGEEVEIPEGYQVMTRGGADFSEIILQKVDGEDLKLVPIDYKELPTQTLKVIRDIIKAGRTVYIGVNTLPDRVPVSFDEIDEIIKEREAAESVSDKDENTDKDNNVDKKDDTSDDEEAVDVTVDDNTDDEGAVVAETETKKPSSTGGKKQGTTSNSKTGTTPANSTPSATTPASDVPDSCTVSFMYNEGTFGEQYIPYGGTATVPKLQPTASGNWYLKNADGSLSTFSFSTPVQDNIILYWQ